jgi:formyltetrahydrofolate synthetase
MAVLALTTSMKDMRDRLGAMVIGMDRKGECVVGLFLTVQWVV